MHQEREHPKRVVGIELVNSDFLGTTHALRVHLEVIAHTGELGSALTRAIQVWLPTVIVL